MNDITSFLITFLTPVVPFILMAAVITPFLIKKCPQWGLFAEVNSRSAHNGKVAVGGGIGIALLTTLGLLANAVMLPNQAELKFLVLLAICAAAIATLGFFDDKENLPAKQRFSMQILAVGICVYLLPQKMPEISIYLEKTVILLAWVWFINLYNFLDGLDGYASLETLFIAIFLFVINPYLAPVSLILAGSTLGFLRFNFPPAKIFLGDVGSTFLGFTLGGLMFLSLDVNTNFYALIIVSSLFTFDATYTLIARVLRGEKPWHPHRQHWYQRCYNMGMSHTQIAFRAVAINIALFILAKVAVNNPDKGLLVLGFTGLFLFVIALRIKYLEG